MSPFRHPGMLARRYPAISLALAATAVAVIPLTASAAVTSHSTTQAAGSASAKAAVKHTATATKSAAAKKAPAAAAAAKTTAGATKTTATAVKTTSTTSTVKAQAAAASAVSTGPYSGVTYAQLEPTGTEGSQESFTPNSDQWANATAIVQAARDMNLSAYAATIAVATAMQESTLRNLTVAVNADSLGLFQQRPSMGWGTPSELTDPTYAAKAFLRELPSDYQNMDLADAAQSVQRSFDGSLYSQWEDQAAQMVYHIANA